MAMSRADAQAWIKDIRNGNGVDRYKWREVLERRGAMAARLWDDGKFTLGVEYGVIMALTEVFELWDDSNDDDKH